MIDLSHLALCDEIEARALRNLASARAFTFHRPTFIMLPASEVWDIPHPYDDAPPNEWERVFLGGLGMILCIASFAASLKFFLTQ